jgi:hypothetical protein
MVKKKEIHSETSSLRTLRIMPRNFNEIEFGFRTGELGKMYSTVHIFDEFLNL